MKHNFKFLIIAFIGLTIVAGCGNQNVNHNDVKVYDDSLIEEIYVDENTFFNEFGNEQAGIYHVPKIIDDSEAAKNINEEIYNIFIGDAEHSSEQIEAGETPDFDNISWDSHWHDSVLSLVVSRNYIAGYADYYIANYDFATKKQLSNNDLLKNEKICEEDFMKELRVTVAKKVDLNNMQNYQNYNHEYYGDDYLAIATVLRSQILSKTNLNIENISVFYNDDGQLSAAVNLFTPAGDGTITDFFTVDMQKEYDDLTATNNFVKAELINNKAFVSFSRTEYSDIYLNEDYIKYETRYPIEGLFGEYVSMSIETVGQDFNPFLILIDTNGQVTYCDISAGVYSAMNFIAVGPIPSISGVTSLENIYGFDGKVINAVLENGNVIDLIAPMQEMDTLITIELANSEWITTDEVYSFVMYDDDFQNFEFYANNQIIYQGTWNYTGITEEGLKYNLFLFNYENGSLLRGTFTLQTCFDDFNAYIEFYDQDDSLSFKKDELVSLMRVYG